MTPSETTIPYGYCRCLCGGKTSLCRYDDATRGYVKGEPRRFLPGHNQRDVEPKFVEEDRGYKTPCWIWLLQITRKGYGGIWDKAVKRQRVAHMVYWERENGKVPTGMQLHHDCRVTRCVNPTHLRLMTPGDHSRLTREHDPRRSKTHCKRGHEFTPDNTYLHRRTKGGYGRACRKCAVLHMRESRAKHAIQH